MANKIAFLVGAHKTGTTFLNQLLTHNKTALESFGIRFDSPETARRSLTPYLVNPKNQSIRVAREYIDRGQERYKRVLISYENISGVVPSFFNRREIYPNISKRIGALREINDGRPVDLFFMIRDYAEFVHSCYSEHIRFCGFISFKEYLEAVYSEPPSWVEVAQKIQHAYPTARLAILQQSTLRKSPERVVATLISDNVPLEFPNAELGRSSISEIGLKVLALMNFHGIRIDDNTFVDSLAKLLPKGDQLKGLTELDDEQAEFYQQRYSKHLDELSSLGLLVS